MTTGTIYTITNQINGKKYVGQTIQDIQQRFREHTYNAKKGLDSTLYRAIRKYGIENFIIEAIDTAETTEELNQKEIDWIQKLGSTQHIGYNMRLGGSHGPLSEEIKQKISKSKKGKPLSEDHKKLLGQIRTGKKQPQSQKDKVSEALSSTWEIDPPDGPKIVITNLRQYCKDHNISDGNLHTYGHTKGYKATKISN